MLACGVAKITAYGGRYEPERLDTQDAYEIWKLYQSTALRPDSVLTGRFVHDPRSADVDGVLRQIEEARFEAERRQLGRDAAEAEDAAGQSRSRASARCLMSHAVTGPSGQRAQGRSKSMDAKKRDKKKPELTMKEKKMKKEAKKK